MTTTQTTSIRFNYAPPQWYLTSGSFTLGGAGAGYCGAYEQFVFIGIAGQEIKGTIDAPWRVELYILNGTQTLSCYPKGLLNKLGITSYFLDWIVPKDGQYSFIFINRDAHEHEVTFTAYLLSSVKSSETFYATDTTTFIVRFTETSISIHVEQLTTALPQQNESFIALIVVFVIVALVAVISVRLRRQRQTQARQMAVPTVQPSPKLYCISCGTELPIGSKFCNRCGTPTA